MGEDLNINIQREYTNEFEEGVKVEQSTPEEFIANLHELIKSADYSDTPFLLGDVFINFLIKRPELFYGNEKIIQILRDKLAEPNILHLNKKLTEFLLEKLVSETKIDEKNIEGRVLFEGGRDIFLSGNSQAGMDSSIDGHLFNMTTFEVLPFSGANQSELRTTAREAENNNDIETRKRIAYASLNDNDFYIHDLSGDSHFTSEHEYTRDQIDFNYFFCYPVKEIVETDLGIKYADYRTDELFCLLTFYKKQDEEGVRMIRDFINRYGREAISIFSIFKDHHDKTGLILSINEHIDPEEVRKLLERYSELGNMYEQVESFVRGETSYYSNKTQTQWGPGFSEGVAEREVKNESLFLDFRLRTRLKDVFIKMVENPVSNITEKIDALRSDIMILLSALSSIKESGKSIDLEYFRNFDLKRNVKPLNMPTEEIAKMRRIYAENYSSKPELQKILLESFDTAVVSGRSEFTILKYQDDMIGFYRIDTLSESAVHLAAFNIDKQFRGVGLGEAIMLEDLDQLAKEKKLYAECDPLARVASNYIERGFFGVGYGQIGEKGTLEIVRDDTRAFATKGQPAEEFVQEYLKFELGGGTSACDQGDYFIVKAHTQAEINMSYLEEGNILTRYFSQTINGPKEWYAVFEKKK